MITLNRQEYRDKVFGCWLGKNIGGTLGAPFEWRRQINQVDFYTQELGGEPLPNDDLDIQLLWLIALEEMGVALDANLLADYWCIYVTPHWAEYGTAKNNMRMGLLPPHSGSFHNDFKDSCGAFIRSEIWACIAPGCPELAAWYAYQDGMLDHGDGEGALAAVFCAALESAAFVESDLRKLIDIGLSYIPAGCAVAGATQAALAAFDAGLAWQAARNRVLEDFRGATFGGDPAATSPADRARGFEQGQLGWDVPSNIGMLTLALLYGRGDFGQTVCTAVNCGEDTDCTAATAGAIYGILGGRQAIPARWVEPIGETIKTACLNLGELGFFGAQLPQTVAEMTRRTEAMADQALARYQPAVRLSDAPTNCAGLTDGVLHAPQGAALRPGARMRRHFGPADAETRRACVTRFPFYEVAVDAGTDPLVRNGVPKAVTLRIRNLYKVQENLRLHWYLPEGWQVSPSADGVAFLPSASLAQQPSLDLDFQLSCEHIQGDVVRAVVELTIPGRPTVMLVPVTLVNGNLFPPAGAGEEGAS